MLIVLSPAKSLDFESPVPEAPVSMPAFLDEAVRLVGILREKSPAELASLMKISDRLAALNVARFETWSRPFTSGNARQAVFAFDGDVYDGLQAKSLAPEALNYLQGHLLILSGLYGLLRPLDLLQAYRLEMSTRLANPAGRDLYAFWGDSITSALNAALAEQGGAPVLVNLASEEYFKAIRPDRLAARVITPVFQECKAGVCRIVSLHAKRARGLMSRYAAEHAIVDPEALKAFDREGYAFEPSASDASRWVFRR